MSRLTIKTNFGDIQIQLQEKDAPITCKNFLEYVKKGFYKGTLFHRVIDGFMIQGGGFDENMVQKETLKSIKNEAKNGLKNIAFSIAMARTSVVDSATSQFFINVAHNDFLNFKSQSPEEFGYCVFANVTKGMDIVLKISKTKTTTKAGHSDVPEKNVIIEDIILPK